MRVKSVQGPTARKEQIQDLTQLAPLVSKPHLAAGWDPQKERSYSCGLLLGSLTPPFPPTARAATHSCMPLVWGGWEGGHSGGRGREIWFEPHGMYNLQ